MRDCAERLSHRARVDYREHRQSKARREIRAARLAIEQTHYPFDQDHIGFAGGLKQKMATAGLAHHPEIDLMDRRSRGSLENHGVEEIRSSLEHARLQPAAP
jgi:hypothetical protein